MCATHALSVPMLCPRNLLILATPLNVGPNDGICKLSSDREEVMVADLRWKDEIGIRHDLSRITSSSRKFSLLDPIVHISFM